MVNIYATAQRHMAAATRRRRALLVADCLQAPVMMKRRHNMTLRERDGDCVNTYTMVEMRHVIVTLSAMPVAAVIV